MEDYDGVPTSLAETDEEAYEVLSQVAPTNGIPSTHGLYRVRRAQGDSALDALVYVLEFIVNANKKIRGR